MKKTDVHARLGTEEQFDVGLAGGLQFAQVRRALMRERVRGRRSALDLAADSVGRFDGAPADLSSNPIHLDGFER